MWQIENDINLDKKIFGGYIKSTVIGCNVDDWMNNLEKVKKYIDENGKRPVKEDKNKEIKKLGIWIGTQLYTYKFNTSIMKNEKVRKLWEKFTKKYNELFLSDEENWLIKYNRLEDFINKYKSIPSNSKTSDTNEITNFNWMANQKQNYKKNRGFVNILNLKNKWEILLKKYPEINESYIDVWLNELKKCDEYINKYGKRPLKGTYEYRWITTNVVSFGKNRGLMNIPEIKNKWSNFINKYKNIFETNDEKWETNFNKFEEYIKKNSKIPNRKNIETKYLAKWYSHQIDKYDKNLSNEQKNKIDNIKKEYPNVLNNYNEIWEEQFRELTKFIKTYNKLPSQKKKRCFAV